MRQKKKLLPHTDIHYTVSNTAREIHSRALDTKFFYRKLLSSETSDKKKLALIVHELLPQNKYGQG